jgi:hypothetical protein
MKIINGNCQYFGWCRANTLCLGSIFISISVYVTEGDDWYLYGKELLEYDQYNACLHITEYEQHKTGLGHCVLRFLVRQ